MKKLTCFAACALLISISSATSTILIPPKLNAKDVLISIGKSGYKISVLELSTISAKDLQKLTGRKMNFIDRVSFKIAQHKLRNSINQDGTFNKKSVARFFKDCETGFHLGGFALGFFVGLIGILIA